MSIQSEINRINNGDAFVDKVQVFEDGRISVNLVYDDCLEELLQVHCTAKMCIRDRQYTKCWKQNGQDI